jgi:hypothetical protein
MTEQRKYKCQKCGLMVILYGGRTCDTMVVCNCGAWMDIYHEEDLTPLQNKEDKGKSGEIAVNRPLNAQIIGKKTMEAKE